MDGAPPRTYRPGMSPAPHSPSTLVAGYDGSEGAAAAVRWAAARVAPDGRLVVVCAARAGSPAVLAPRRRDRARAGLEALWMVEDKLADADVELVVDDAPPAEALCRVAHDAGADGIVVGRHHPGPFSADTVRQLLDVADLPVTVVPS
jgi:nucleotide-binding universal stress UspA family protein